MKEDTKNVIIKKMNKILLINFLIKKIWCFDNF